MHDPAAWGARPAQQASVHVEPADTAARGTTFIRNPLSSVRVSATLAAPAIVIRVGSARVILSSVEREFCHITRLWAKLLVAKLGGGWFPFLSARKQAASLHSDNYSCFREPDRAYRSPGHIDISDTAPAARTFSVPAVRSRSCAGASRWGSGPATAERVCAGP